MEPTGPVAVDLFSGAGGLAEGLLKAGVQVAASIELHPQPALSHAFNHPETRVLAGDIRNLEAAKLDAAIRSRAGRAPVDVVVGGPPCQGFSSAGKKSVTDPRNSLFRHYVRVVEHLKPRMFLLENVPGFKSMYGGAVYAEALEAMHNLGYTTVDRIIHVKDLGVPQRRRRFVMVGWLPGAADPYEWPPITHAEVGGTAGLFDDLVEPLVTAGDALDDLSFLDPGYEATGYVDASISKFALDRRGSNTTLFNHLATRHRRKSADIIRRIAVGGSIRDIPVAERGTKKLTMRKLDPDAISNTVVALPDDILHYSQARILTVREMARLQSFDDDFVFLGKRTSGFVERRVDVPQYTQVGNAVPPLFAEALGRALVKSLGSVPGDLRNLELRRDRHKLVCGTSGFAGYELTPDAVNEIELTAVGGSLLPLPISEEAIPVLEQKPLRDWTSDANPRRGQWAPGVVAAEVPSWQSQPRGDTDH
ncbi:DNA cytosine methyltransferase [Mycobacterium sp. 1274761.0]|uniref:DNA cytosine methyltransferase n=1 Tax=Mycobacterium sp. 1274761.0 TaxID=1834077 RepID=UPI0018D422C6|nr:DNA cytosine methyltransferase [Mycobacterium sp. 1274761.0]